MESEKIEDTESEQLDRKKSDSDIALESSDSVSNSSRADSPTVPKHTNSLSLSSSLTFEAT